MTRVGIDTRTKRYRTFFLNGKKQERNVWLFTLIDINFKNRAFLDRHHTVTPAAIFFCIRTACRYHRLVTREKVKNDIERSFNQPPILRAEDVGGNFGADALRNAYDYYNSVTEVERLQVERVLFGVLTVNGKRALMGFDKLDDSNDSKSILAEKNG
jgi:hypothetical protein